MKRIPLTQGKEALVDDQDYEYLMQWKWCWHWTARRTTTYARRDIGGRRHKSSVHMHRVIAERMGHLAQGRQIDHVDGNGLNNQRSNLRVATQSENGGNRGRNRNNKSGYKGVCWDATRQKWLAALKHRGRQVLHKRFDDPKEAARAYNDAALKHFGAFAFLNPV
jgi:hypothetical protein